MAEETPKELHAQLLHAPLKVGFLSGVPQGSGGGREAMIEPQHLLSIMRQCALLGLSRSSVYYRPVLAPVHRAAVALGQV